MIDVSSLAPLQATVALLIERSGNEGRRVCEICKETKRGKGAIVNVLRHLLDTGIITKIHGDVPRYYPPMDSSRSPMDSPNAVKLPRKERKNHDSNKERNKEKGNFVNEEESELSSSPVKARKGVRRNALLINTEKERQANRAARRTLQNAVADLEYVEGEDNGYKVFTYWHPHDPYFPVTLQIPEIMPEKGSFDGLIFAKELNRERSLDRMLHMLTPDSETDAVDTLTKNRYNFFVEQVNHLFGRLCGKKRGEGVRHEIAYTLSDDMTQRLAFAFAMAPKGLRTLAERENFLEDCKNRTSELYKIWSPVLIKLRPIYHRNEWGWDSLIFDKDNAWAVELEHHSDSPRLILFPGKKYRDTYQEKKQAQQAAAVHITKQQSLDVAKRETAATALCDETGLKVLAALKGNVSADFFLQSDTICQFDGTTVTFVVSNDFARNAIKRHIPDVIDSAVSAVVGDGVSFQIVTREQLERTAAAKENAKRMRLEHEAAEEEYKQKQLVMQ